jgi:hypothetical protein
MTVKVSDVAKHLQENFDFNTDMGTDFSYR